MIHIRRCHICGEISESENSKIEKCISCGKYLAPFMFCHDPSDNNESHAQKTTPSASFLKPEYPPIYGISLYW